MDHAKKNKKHRHTKKNKKHVHATKKKKSTIEQEEISTLQTKRNNLGEVNPDDIISFAKVPLSHRTLRGLKDNGFTEPTKVQKQSLVYSLRGLDVVAAAKTGSGKTLAFIIPLLESLYSKRWTSFDGLGALVITPTRELAYQIYEVLNKVGKHHDFSAGLVIGGKDLKYEWDRIGSCNIMICTPGRLLQHMTENAEFNYSSVQVVVLDEADQCLSMGFAESMNCILQELPNDRQTLLFSATQTRDVKDLIRAGCKNPVYCSVHEHSKTTTPSNLKESFVVVDVHDKFNFLWSFLRHHKHTKILVFFSTCKQVKYMFDMFCKLHPGLSVMSLHGSMHQLRRMAVYDDFCRKKHAVLFATDVAARGLAIPKVVKEWIGHLEQPCEMAFFIIGRTKNPTYELGGQDFLLVSTLDFVDPVLSIFRNMKIVEHLEKTVDPNKLSSAHIKVEIVLSKYVNLKEEAQRAFKSYIKSYAMMRDKKIFDVTSIDVDAFARSLGLGVTPRIRFLEKRLKLKSKVQADADYQSPIPGKKKLTTLDFGADDDDDDDDDFLKSSKKKSVIIEESEEEKGEENEESQIGVIIKSSKKPLTKFAVAKRLLKKNLQVNTRQVFDEEGELVLDPTKQQISEAWGEADSGEGSGAGIDIPRLAEALKEEDKHDKKIQHQRVKEKHKIQQKNNFTKKSWVRLGAPDESSASEEDDSDMDDDTQAFIDALPDPDKLYGKKDGSDNDDDESGEDEKDDEDESEEEDDSASESEDDSSRMKQDLPDRIRGCVMMQKKRAGPQPSKEAKRARLAQSDTLGALPTDEKEQLALFLLRGGRK
ncbi:unnamed protein product, partial [Meganyctiphanes norvegica]